MQQGMAGPSWEEVLKQKCKIPQWCKIATVPLRDQDAAKVKRRG